MMRKKKEGGGAKSLGIHSRPGAESKRPKGPKRSASNSPGRPNRRHPQDKARGATSPSAAPTQNEADGEGEHEKRSGKSQKKAMMKRMAR